MAPDALTLVETLRAAADEHCDAVDVHNFQPTTARLLREAADALAARETLTREEAERRFKADDTFPIMMAHGSDKWRLPMSLFRPHEAQAKWNHSQTLDRLRERGGLSPCEAVAVLEDRRWHRMDYSEAVTRLVLAALFPHDGSRT